MTKTWLKVVDMNEHDHLKMNNIMGKKSKG